MQKDGELRRVHMHGMLANGAARARPVTFERGAPLLAHRFGDSESRTGSESDQHRRFGSITRGPPQHKQILKRSHGARPLPVTAGRCC